MRNFMQWAQGVDVRGLNLALKLHPELWDMHPNRKLGDKSPHTEVHDIWVRANDRTKCEESKDYSTFNDMHYPVFYPAWAALPQLRPLVLGLMAQLEALHLGTILITKIPPGCSVKPHKDFGWNATFYNTKLYIPLQTNQKCWNRCEDEFVVMREGEIWFFNNLVEHEVKNEGTEDRITLIVCMKRE